MIYTTLDTFYVSHQQMLDSPSRRDGVDENVENLLRIYGCEIIQECGILLKLYVSLSLSLSNFFVQVFWRLVHSLSSVFDVSVYRGWSRVLLVN